MAINYTTLLGLAQPVTGTESNVWGDAVNNQLTALVDSAIAGAATISVTAGNVTLTDLDGAADQARMAILILTGTPGTTRNVIAPSRSKTYIVINQSDSSAVIKGSATTGVTVRAGQAATCVWNGADFEIVASGDVDGPASATDNAIVRYDGATGKLIQNSAVTIDDSNNVSGVVQLNATTVDTTNIEVTSLKAKDGTAAGSIANSTGVVTLASTVLTTTDINGGTIDATTIGASTPSTVVATQVDITAQGDLRLQDTTGGQFVALQAPGTIATSYTLTLPVDDGTSGQALITDGSGVLSWSSAASGDVYGPASATDNAVARYDGTTGKIIQNSAVTIADDGATVIDANSTTDALRITQIGAGNALLVEDSANPDATPTVVTADGNVVVGNTTSLTYLTGIQPKIQVNSTGISGIGISRWNAGVATNALTFLKSRGTTIGDFTSVASGDFTGSINFYGADGTTGVISAQIAAQVDGTPGTNDMPGRLVFSTTADGSAIATERMRIDSAGVTTISGTGIINANSTTDALRITQVGTGNALLVEDSANPDATPTVIDTNGRIITGNTASVSVLGVEAGIQAYSNFGYTAQGRFTNDAFSPFLNLVKSRSTTVGGQTVVQSGDALGSIAFSGSDGTAFIRSAQIASEVDGTPGTNDMPGRLVFSTTADGASSPTERMRIDSAGKVGIGTTSLAGQSVRISTPITGATSSNGIWVSSQVQSDVTTNANYVTAIGTQAAGGALTSLRYFNADQSTLSGTVTNQFGFAVQSNLTGATNNYGFYSNIASGTGRWNFYAAGTADNYFAGNVGIGRTPTSIFQVSKGGTLPTLNGTETGIFQWNGVTGHTSTVAIVAGNAATSQLAFGDAEDIDIGYINYEHPNNAFAFATNATERMRIASTGIISLGASPGSESLRVTPVASAVNYLTVSGSATGFTPNIQAQGSDTNIAISITSKGGSPIDFFTSAFGAQQFRIAHTASAVNYLQAAGGATGSGATLSAQGSDTDISVIYKNKGTGVHFFQTSNTNQFVITHQASAVNYAGVQGSTTGNAPLFYVQGSDTNIDLSLVPKGTGVLRFGTLTANADAPITGYITIKDSAGNLRKLAVIA